MRLLPVLVLLLAGCAAIERYSVDAQVPSTPETVVWGYLPAGRAPVLTIKPGRTVRIDTVSHQGLINGMHPVKFFGDAGIPAKEVLPDAIAIYEKVQRPKDAGAHVLTGPIYIEGAEPGDMLEVRVRDLEFRVPYGVNNSGKGAGVLPDLHGRPYPKVIRDRKSTRLNSSHDQISYAVFCLKKKKKNNRERSRMNHTLGNFNQERRRQAHVGFMEKQRIGRRCEINMRERNQLQSVMCLSKA